MRYFVLIFLLLFLSLPSQAQDAGIRFSRLGVPEGLPGHTIYDIINDSQGYLWFATDNGLARYDGYELITFKPEKGDSLSLLDAFTTAIMEDHKGYLWVGTTNGINRFDGRKFEIPKNTAEYV